MRDGLLNNIVKNTVKHHASAERFVVFAAALRLPMVFALVELIRNKTIGLINNALNSRSCQASMRVTNRLREPFKEAEILAPTKKRY